MALLINLNDDFLGSGSIARPIYDARGKYIKALGETKVTKGVADAILECKKYGLSLYAMTIKEEYLQVVNYLNTTYGTGSGIKNILNGVLESGSWYVYNPNQKNLYAGAVPVAGSGNCLAIIGTGSNLIMNSVSCTDFTAYSFCEIVWFCIYLVKSIRILLRKY